MAVPIITAQPQPQEVVETEVANFSVSAELPPGGDPLWDSITGLWNFNNGSGTFQNNLATGAAGAGSDAIAVNGAEIVGVNSKFGTGTMYMDGVGGDAGEVRAAANTLAPPAAAFTMEIRARHNAVPAADRAIISSTNTNGLRLILKADGTAYLSGRGSNITRFLINSVGAVPLNQQNDYTAQFDGVDRWDFWINGVWIGTDTQSGAISHGTTFRLFFELWGNVRSEGWVDTIRFTNGNRFTAGVDHAVPTADYPTAPGAPVPGVVEYQWKKDTVDIPGETSDTLALTTALADNGAQISVLCSHSEEPSDTVLSDDALLTVNSIASQLPVIDTQPTSQTVEEDTAATFTVVASDPSGTGLTYQWYLDGSPVAGETSATANITPADPGTYSVFCRVSNAYGNTDTDTVTLTANQAPPKYTVTLDPYRDPIFKRGYVELSRPLNEGEYIQIERKTEIVRNFEAVAREPFPAEQFEFTMDKICLIQQEIEGHKCDCRAPNRPAPEPPDPGEGGPGTDPCVPYTCDAITSYMLAAADAYWKMQDPTWRTGLADDTSLNPETGEPGVGGEFYKESGLVVSPAPPQWRFLAGHSDTDWNGQHDKSAYVLGTDPDYCEITAVEFVASDYLTPFPTGFSRFELTDSQWQLNYPAPGDPGAGAQGSAAGLGVPSRELFATALIRGQLYCPTAAQGVKPFDFNTDISSDRGAGPTGGTTGISMTNVDIRGPSFLPQSVFVQALAGETSVVFNDTITLPDDFDPSEPWILVFGGGVTDKDAPLDGDPFGTGYNGTDFTARIVVKIYQKGRGLVVDYDRSETLTVFQNVNDAGDPDFRWWYRQMGEGNVNGDTKFLANARGVVQGVNLGTTFPNIEELGLALEQNYTDYQVPPECEV